MNNKIRFFTFVSLLLIITLISINFSNNEKYKMTNKNNDTDKVIDLNEDMITEVSKTQNKTLEDIENEEEVLVKPITFSWPCKGNIIIKFSPSQIIYDEILDQYRTSNGIVMKTQSKELTSMCDGKITSIFTTSDYEKEITIKTTENHTIVLRGPFDNISHKEGNIILKGTKIGDIKTSAEYSYIDISVMKNNEYIDPISLIS